MILGLLGQLFEPVQMKIFLDPVGPILGSQGPILGPKWAILGSFALRGKHSPKWMILGLPGQLFESARMKILLDPIRPILGSSGAYFGSKMGHLRLICP